MKKFLLLISTAMLVSFGHSQYLKINDFNYLNKGVWELQKNGYEPRKDLKMILTYGAKQSSSNWYFMCHKVCLDSFYLGYVLTAKPSAESENVYNLFFLNRSYVFVDKHNMDMITKYPINSNQSMFLYRTTTTDLYKLDGKCK